ncbi:ZinT family metal-binding protein [Pseudoroseicyclus sp. H15]
MTFKPLFSAALLCLAAPAFAQTDHSHAHSHADEDISRGYFEDAQVAPRALSDWEGDWQSVYPLLLDGTLAPVMAQKAEAGEMTAEEYTAYYETGYATDVGRILIEGSTVTFFTGETSISGTYEDDGYEILTYEAGNRGVRFSFEKTAGDAGAPAFIQFSDHNIAPTDAGHYHLYWGDDRAAVLSELTNWPTYFPADDSPEDILADMLAH